MLFFNAATQKAFTTLLAGLAFTLTSLLNTVRLPALVAGLTRVLIITNPGIVNLLLVFTSLAPTSARLSSIFFTSLTASSELLAMASARPALESDLAAAALALAA